MQEAELDNNRHRFVDES